MIRKRAWSGILLAAIVLGITPGLGMAAQRLQTAAPLQNPGFEGLSCREGSVPPRCLDNWTRATYNGNQFEDVYTPQGWVTWWSTADGASRPKVDTIPNEGAFTGTLPRIHSGYYAVRMMPDNMYLTLNAGLYQVVSGLTPGATVQFSAYAHGWVCDNDERVGYSCGDRGNVFFRVGIEPNGATGAPAAGVIWSPEQWGVWDQYALIGPVTAQVGASGSVAVYLHAKTKWPVKHQEVYWDDASLVYTGQPAATATSAAPAGQPTITAGADGLNVRSGPGTNFPILAHVNPGTQFRVTGKYADWWQIDYNGAPAWAYSGVVVAQNTDNVPQVVPPPSPVPAAPSPTPIPPTLTPISTEAVLPTETLTPEAGFPAATAAPTGGASICVLAYHDRNGDTFRNDAATEELLPNAEIAVADASGVIARYTTDGVSEPYCFTVAPGDYRVVQTSPPGYVPSSLAEQIAGVAGGTTLSLQFGNVRGQGPIATVTIEATQTSERSAGILGSSNARLFSTIAKISGALVLFLALVLAILFVLNQRRR